MYSKFQLIGTFIPEVRFHAGFPNDDVNQMNDGRVIVYRMNGYYNGRPFFEYLFSPKTATIKWEEYAELKIMAWIVSTKQK